MRRRGGIGSPRQMHLKRIAWNTVEDHSCILGILGNLKNFTMLQAWQAPWVSKVQSVLGIPLFQISNYALGRAMLIKRHLVVA